METEEASYEWPAVEPKYSPGNFEVIVTADSKLQNSPVDYSLSSAKDRHQTADFQCKIEVEWHEEEADEWSRVPPEYYLGGFDLTVAVHPQADGLQDQPIDLSISSQQFSPHQYETEMELDVRQPEFNVDGQIQEESANNSISNETSDFPVRDEKVSRDGSPEFYRYDIYSNAPVDYELQNHPTDNSVTSAENYLQVQCKIEIESDEEEEDEWKNYTENYEDYLDPTVTADDQINHFQEQPLDLSLSGTQDHFQNGDQEVSYKWYILPEEYYDGTPVNYQVYQPQEGPADEFVDYLEVPYQINPLTENNEVSSPMSYFETRVIPRLNLDTPQEV